MKDKVVMSKINGQLAVAIPLFRLQDSQELVSLSCYMVTFLNEKPLAYVVECFDECQLMNSDYVENNLEVLGDL